jgi:hypothetical protein
MEAHASAGHAVMLSSAKSCLRCGFDNTGTALFRITAWPNGNHERQEPACGAMYQPYGPVELGFVNSVIGELALDVLLGEAQSGVHRMWIGSGKRVRQLGGSWSEAWLADPRFRDEGAFVAEREWPLAVCQECQKADAA